MLGYYHLVVIHNENFVAPDIHVTPAGEEVF